MRRLFYLFLFISLSINLLAQNKKSAISNNRRVKTTQVSKQSAPKVDIKQINNQLTAVFPINEHLNFHGVAIDCDAATFREKLTRIGFKYAYVWNGRYDKTRISGPIWKDKRDGLYVYPKNGKLITSINAGVSYTSRSEAEKDFKTALISIKEEFPSALVDYREFSNQDGRKHEQFCFRIISQETKHILGSVYLKFFTSAKKTDWSISLDYKDYSNCMETDNFKYGIYDLSNLAKPYCETCFARVDDNAITFKIRKDGKEKTVIAYAFDYQDLKKVLFQEQMSDYGKQEQLAIYLKHLQISSLPAICYTDYLFRGTNPKDEIFVPSSQQSGILGFGESLFHEYFGNHPTNSAKDAYGFYENY